nr:acylphosphatase [Aquincola tertiaricarbonis]
MIDSEPPGDALHVNNPVEHWCVRVHGRVQGVGYRDACVTSARHIGVTGWVRNRADGSVEAELHGTADQLLAMRRWMAAGPPLARVHNIEWHPASRNTPACASFERRSTL